MRRVLEEVNEGGMRPARPKFSQPLSLHPYYKTNKSELSKDSQRGQQTADGATVGSNPSRSSKLQFVSLVLTLRKELPARLDAAPHA